MLKKKFKLYQGKSSRSPQRNAVSTLYANLGFLSVDQPLRTIAITSSIPNEGKTTISLELSRAMAASGKRTLLMECDMRRRSLASRLGAHTCAGVCAVVMGDVELGRAVVRTSLPNLHFLDAEPDVACPVDILDSRRFRELVAYVGGRYDYVVIDTPPVGTFVDAAVVGSAADATLLVVREGFVERASAANACDQLRKAGANLIGTVVNCCATAASSHCEAYDDAEG